MVEDVVDPVLGPLTFDDARGGFVSEPVAIPWLDGRRCRFVLEGDPYAPSTDVGRAVRSLLEAGPKLLGDAATHVTLYRDEILALYREQGRPLESVGAPSDIWTQVAFGDEFYVSLRAKGDTEDGVYLSLECNCDWEPEHGLQLVFRGGRTVSKVGPFDGHVTNSDAFAKRSLAGVVYKTIASTVADFRRGR